MNPCFNCSKILEGVMASRLRGEYSFERFNRGAKSTALTYMSLLIWKRSMTAYHEQCLIEARENEKYAQVF